MSISSTDSAAWTYACAHDHPATRRSSRSKIVLNSAAASVLLILAVGTLANSNSLPDAIVSWGYPALWILPTVLLSFGLRAVVLTRAALHEQKVLLTYPWQRLHGVVHIDVAGRHKLVLPNPEAPREKIQLLTGRRLFPSTAGTSSSPGSVLPDEVWFAGDPRFTGVAALPGPRRMLTVLRPSVRDSGVAAYNGPISEEARRRALAVGARVAPAEAVLERGPVLVPDPAKVAMHHPETAAGWRRSLLRRRVALYGQIAAFVAFFTTISVVDDPNSLIPIAGILMVVSPITLVCAAVAVGGARRLGRTLRTYPWQEYVGEPENGTGVVLLKLEKGRQVRLRSLPLRRQFQSADRFWFAGDVRYGGAVSEAGGNRPTRVVHVDPGKAHDSLPGTPEADALAEKSGLTRAGRPRTWAY